MAYEEIWQKIRNMNQRDRKKLAYEMSLKECNVGYIHPHYYYDDKTVHDIIFYHPNSQKEINDKGGNYLNALKEIIENDKEIQVRIKRYAWLPRVINDWIEGEVVKSYICARYNSDWLNRWYRILPGKSLAGERPRTLFLWKNDNSEVLYKMTACNYKDGYEQMTFERMEK